MKSVARSTLRTVLLERLQQTEQRSFAHDEALGRSSQREPVSLPVPQDSKPLPWPVTGTATPRKSTKAPPEEIILGLKAAHVLLKGVE